MQRAGAPQSNTDENHTISLSGISLQDLSRLLGGAPRTGGALAPQEAHDDPDEEPDDDDDEYEDDDDYQPNHASRRYVFPAVTEPQEAGVQLINSGDFGRIAPKIRARRESTNLAKRIFNRPQNPYGAQYKEDYTNVWH